MARLPIDADILPPSDDRRTKSMSNEQLEMSNDPCQ